MIGIGILGCGTVASGVIKLLGSNSYNIRMQSDGIRVVKVLARHPEKARALGLGEEQICGDIETILSDPDITVVAELMGGTDTAYEYVKRALRSGRHVVSANKDLMALHLHELLQLAEEHGVTLSFEASVGGGIPLIGPLSRTLSAGRIQSISGILNGTTNYILTRMTNAGLSYEDALREAQEKGYAEADPTSDVEGADAARKVAILASLAFHTPVTYENVKHEGISRLTETDIRFAESSGYTVKLLGVTREKDGKIEAFVRPALVPHEHPLSSVSYAYNAVFITGEAVGDIMLYGQGAGSLPTAASVVSDIMEIARRGTAPARTESVFYEHFPVADAGESESVYYVRLLVEDKPRVLAGIAGVFGACSISLASLVQEQRPDGNAELMLFTHTARESDMARAMHALNALSYVKAGNSIICL